MGSSKSNTLNPSSASSFQISHHSTSSTASSARPSSAASIQNPTDTSKFSISPNSNSTTSQQQISTPPNSHSTISNEQQRPIRFPFHYPNVVAQKSTTVPSSDPIRGRWVRSFLPKTTPSTSQNFNGYAQQPTIALSSDSIIPNDPQLRGRWTRSVISRANPSTLQNSNNDNNYGQQQMTVSNISSATSSGSVIRISMFVVPLCVTVAWILGIQMNLNFNLLNTSSVALAIITLITTIFTLKDGTSHYLKGLVIFLCFIVIGACLFSTKNTNQ